jgi:xanthine dehydrogenase YagR molybdenum-binding subunit
MLANQDRTQEKAPQKGVQGESKPVRGAAQKDQQKPTRDQQVLFGIPQLGLSQVERVVPADEPPPLPANNELQYIGKSTPRYDGVAKVTGRAQYTADVRLPGMLYGRLVGADVPHARVKSIDVSAAQQYPGVRAVHVIQHVLGNAELRDPKQEMPSNYPIVRYAGQPVAATSQAVADEAAKRIKVEYEPLDFAIDRDMARKSDSPKVYPGPADQGGSAGGGGGPKDVPQVGNVHGPELKKAGDVERGFSEADVTVKGEYETQVQTHSALETHGVVADWSRIY